MGCVPYLLTCIVYISKMIKSITYKQCGPGNERIVLIYRGYERYDSKMGKRRVVEAVMEDNKRNDDDGYEFLYLNI